MLLAVVAVALGAAAGLLAGRRPPAEHPGSRPGDLLVLAGGVGASVAAGRLADAGAALALGLCGYTLLVVFAVRHRHHPGMVVIAIGLLSNLVVVGVDHGMPVSTLAAGVSAGLHHGLGATDHLRGLADVVRLPGTATTISPGDVVLSLGGALAAFAWLSPTDTRPPARRPSGRLRS